MRIATAACLLFLALGACATSPASLRPLFAQKTAGGCAAAYFDERDILLATAGTYDGQVTRYDPANGLFFSVGIDRERLGPTCEGVNPEKYLSRPRSFGVAVSLLSNDAARKAFDAAPVDAEPLKALITAPAPYFRMNEIYEGQPMLTGLDVKVPLQERDAWRDGLRKYSAADAAAMAARANHQAKLQRAEARRAVTEHRATFDNAQAVWENRARATYNVGDKVCTSSNEFGTLEQITADRFKLHVIGRVRSSQATFFSGLSGIGTYERVEAPRWVPRGEVAHCEFSA